VGDGRIAAHRARAAKMTRQMSGDFVTAAYGSHLFRREGFSLRNRLQRAIRRVKSDDWYGQKSMLDTAA
jgi:hypothetical protein